MNQKHKGITTTTSTINKFILSQAPSFLRFSLDKLDMLVHMEDYLSSQTMEHFDCKTNHLSKFSVVVNVIHLSQASYANLSLANVAIYLPMSMFICVLLVLVWLARFFTVLLGKDQNEKRQYSLSL
jgi:hypothetical protein